MLFPIQAILYVHLKKRSGFGFRNTLIVNFDTDIFIIRYIDSFLSLMMIYLL